MPERILVADDDPDILQFVRVNLELEGFEVDVAHDGKEAMAKVMASPPDLVLLDVMMPEMDGLTALRRLRMHPAATNTSVILLTAKTLPEDRVRGLELGADDYVTKPFDVDELMARVKAVLRRTQAMRDVSPLTGLPGNFRISSELEDRDCRGRSLCRGSRRSRQFQSIQRSLRIHARRPGDQVHRARHARGSRRDRRPNARLSAMSAATTSSPPSTPT